MDDNRERRIDEAMLAKMTARATELGFDSVEEYVRALLECDQSIGTLEEEKAFHARRRAMSEESNFDHSAN